MYCGKQKPRCEGKILPQLTPGDFKDFYLEQRYLWEMERGESGLLAQLSTPWSSTAKPVVIPKRNYMRHEYPRTDHRDRFRKAGHWEEKILLMEIHELKCRLGGCKGGIVQSKGKVVVGEVDSDDSYDSDEDWGLPY